MKKIALFAFISSLLLVSCDPESSQQTSYTPLGDYDSGVLVLNQGNYQGNNSEISFISFDLNTLNNSIFSTVNPTLTLGDTGQDIGFYNQYAYVVLNESSKIQIINRYTMQNLGAIETGLNNPRYIAFANGKGYVTNWGDGGDPSDDYVAVINLETKTITTTISVTEGPERIIENAGKLYVAHSGGFGYGNTVSVINEATNEVSSIVVGDVPNAMQINEGFLWVSCGGKPSYSGNETAGKIVKINLNNNTISSTFPFSVSTNHPSNLVIYGSFVYFTKDTGIYKMALNDTSLPATPAFTTTNQGVYGIYSFAIKSNHIYVGDAGDYTTNGKVLIYSLGTNTPIGTLEKEHSVGVIPTGFYFNQ